MGFLSHHPYHALVFPGVIHDENRVNEEAAMAPIADGLIFFFSQDATPLGSRVDSPSSPSSARING